MFAWLLETADAATCDVDWLVESLTAVVLTWLVGRLLELAVESIVAAWTLAVVAELLEEAVNDAWSLLWLVVEESVASVEALLFAAVTIVWFGTLLSAWAKVVVNAVEPINEITDSPMTIQSLPDL